jgi:hypothetical protein
MTTIHHPRVRVKAADDKDYAPHPFVSLAIVVAGAVIAALIRQFIH